MRIGCWRDSAVYSSQAEPVESDKALAQYDQGKVRSQVGVLAGAITADDLEKSDDISVSVL
eukprot:11158623-Lingulodinium_polyedra.AAC.1